MRVCSVLAFLLLLQLLALTAPNVSCSEASYQQRAGEAFDYSGIMDYLEKPSFWEQVKGHIEYFAGLGSRFTGYQGCDEAAQYIADRFEEYGLKPGGDEGFFEFYNVTVPIDRGADIQVIGEDFHVNAYALLPNGIQTGYTPPEGVEGKLLYFKDGSIEEISEVLQKTGISLTDTIALLEFNTFNNWFNLAVRGVKAIIFIEPPDMTRMEAESKIALTPLKVTKLYVSRNDGEALKTMIGKRVRVYSDMRYEVVKAKNVIGVLEGELKNDVVIFSSYYDGSSIVPKIAPAADEATGISVLLEMVKFFAETKPRRTIWFVAFSGHWQALAGAREFVEKHYFDPKVQSDELKLWLHINLDYSTESHKVAWIHYGSMWAQIRISGLFDALFTMISKDIFQGLKSVGFNYTEYVCEPAVPFMRSYFVHDAEPTVISGAAAFSFRTADSMRLHYITPFNTIGKVHLEALKKQVEFSLSAMWSFAQADSLPLVWDKEHAKPTRRFMRSGTGWVGRKGFAGIYGDVVRYDPSTRWYTSEGLQDYDLYIDVALSSSRLNPFCHTIVKLGSDAKFRVVGVGTDYVFPETGYGPHYVWVAGRELGVSPVKVTAFALNKTTGEIEWATDSNIDLWGWPQNLGFLPDREDGWKDVRVSVFKTEEVIIYNILDHETLQPPWIDFNWRLSSFTRFDKESDSPTFFSPMTMLDVRDFNTHGKLIHWGAITHLDTAEPVEMLFLPADTRFEVILSSATGPIGVLINADESNPTGVGFKVGQRETLRIDGLFQTAKDLYWLNRQRRDRILSYGVFSYLSERALAFSKEHLDEAVKASLDNNLVSVIGQSILSWGWSVRAYAEMRSLITSLTYTFIFFSVMILPFAFLFERLILSIRGIKRVFSIALMYITPFLILSFSHPGFEIALNAPVAMMAFVQIAFSVVVILLISGAIGGIFKEVRGKLVGLHFAEISRTGAAIMAMSQGVENMKRRKLRTGLTIITFILISFSVVLLTSATADWIVSKGASKPGAEYSGVMIESKLGIENIGEGVVSALKVYAQKYNGTIARRAWLYPPPFSGQDPLTGRQYWSIKADGKSLEVWVMLGLEPQEKKMLNLDAAIVSGRFFIEEDLTGVIISKAAAEELGVKVGSSVTMAGMKLTIVGIVDDEILWSMKDLDGINVLPIDFVEVRRRLKGSPLSVELMREMSTTTRTYPTHVMIVPYRLIESISKATPRSVALILPDVELLKKVAEELALIQTSLTNFVGDKQASVTDLYSSVFQVIIKGWSTMIIPFIIAGFIMLNLMLGAVYERTREIGVLASVGLSPTHISSMFLAESLIFALVGAVLGYIPGIIGIRLLVARGLFPEGFIPGYASIYVVAVMSGMILLALLSTVYPMMKASGLVTPSLMRRWRLSVRRGEDRLSVPLPFFSPEDTVPAVLAFMSEYLENCAVEGAGPFLTLKMPRYVEDQTRFTVRKLIEAVVALPPYDTNVTQSIQLIAHGRIGDVRFNFSLEAVPLTGSIDVWRRTSANFVGEIRKQLILWNTLKEEERRRYIERAREITMKLAESGETA